MQWCFSRCELGPVLHEPCFTTAGCIEVIIKLFNNLPVTFSIDGDGNRFFLEPIVCEIKVVNIHNKHTVALYTIYDEYCKQELTKEKIGL